MPVGQCCICGATAELTFEHIPPRAAFNDKRVFEADIQALIDEKWMPTGAPEKGRVQQQGVGRHSLCGPCNSKTGSWYGSSYVDWSRQAMRILSRSGGNLTLAYPYKVFPLRIIKQICAMFFSACGPGLGQRFPNLVRFVLNRTQQNMPSGLSVYAYLYHPTESTAFRQSGMTGVVDLSEPPKTYRFSEIAFPPFGFILTTDRMPINLDLTNISYFAGYPFHIRPAMFVKLPVLPVTSWLPGDFRTVDEIQRSVNQNRVLGQYHLDQEIR